LHGANASLSARESKIGAGGRPRGWHRSRTVGSPRVESCLLRFDPCLLRKDGYSAATEHKSERNGETYRAFTRGCPRDILDIGPRRACCRRHNSAQKRNNFETEVVIQQRHDVDRLVDLTNAEQNLISKLGILGIQIDSKSRDVGGPSAIVRSNRAPADSRFLLSRRNETNKRSSDELRRDHGGRRARRVN